MHIFAFGFSYLYGSLDIGPASTFNENHIFSCAYAHVLDKVAKAMKFQCITSRKKTSTQIYDKECTEYELKLHSLHIFGE